MSFFFSCEINEHPFTTMLTREPTFRLPVFRAAGSNGSSFPSTSGALCSNLDPSGSSFFVERHLSCDIACSL